MMNWPEFKAWVTAKNPAVQFREDAIKYRVFAWDGPDYNECEIFKDSPSRVNFSPEQVDQNTSWREDFETNYKADSNWAIGSRAYPFATGDFDFQRKGMFNTVTTSEYDMFMKVWDDHLYLNGGTLYCGTGFTFGDWAEMAIVDHDNLLGYGVDFVLKTWILSSYPDPTGKCEIITPYAGNPPKNFYIRVKYHRIGEATVPVAVNFNFHKAI